MVKNGNEYYGTFYFLVDEVRYGYLEGCCSGDPTPSGSATINIELTAGQVVGVDNIISTVIYGTNPNGFLNSWFTGHLLYAL